MLPSNIARKQQNITSGPFFKGADVIIIVNGVVV